jgi:hypothetical protein
VSLLLFLFFMVSSQSNLLKLTSDFSLPISQPSPFQLQLCLSLSTNCTPSSTLPSLSTLDLNLLYLHAHHIPLEYISQLSKCGRTPSHQHCPRILEPRELQLQLRRPCLSPQRKYLQNDSKSINDSDLSLRPPIILCRCNFQL